MDLEANVTAKHSSDDITTLRPDWSKQTRDSHQESEHRETHIIIHHCKHTVTVNSKLKNNKQIHNKTQTCITHVSTVQKCSNDVVDYCASSNKHNFAIGRVSCF